MSTTQKLASDSFRGPIKTITFTSAEISTSGRKYFTEQIIWNPIQRDFRMQLAAGATLAWTETVPKMSVYRTIASVTITPALSFTNWCTPQDSSTNTRDQTSSITLTSTIPTFVQVFASYFHKNWLILENLKQTIANSSTHSKRTKSTLWVFLTT